MLHKKVIYTTVIIILAYAIIYQYAIYFINDQKMNEKMIPHLKAAFEAASSDSLRCEYSYYIAEIYTRIVY